MGPLRKQFTTVAFLTDFSDGDSCVVIVDHDNNAIIVRAPGEDEKTQGTVTSDFQQGEECVVEVVVERTDCPYTRDVFIVNRQVVH